MTGREHHMLSRSALISAVVAVSLPLPIQAHDIYWNLENE
jgi:hypothetical protein